jgi:hypothetical protein
MTKSEQQRQKAADKARRRRARQKQDPVFREKQREYEREKYLKKKAEGKTLPHTKESRKSLQAKWRAWKQKQRSKEWVGF